MVRELPNILSHNFLRTLLWNCNRAHCLAANLNDEANSMDVVGVRIPNLCYTKQSLIRIEGLSCAWQCSRRVVLNATNALQRCESRRTQFFLKRNK